MSHPINHSSLGKKRAFQTNHQGWAWLSLSLVLALHVTDEALTDFLSVYNPTVQAIRARLPFVPLPTFTFEVWLAGLILAVILLLLATPAAFHGARWVRLLAFPFALLMFGNGLLHIIGSFYLGRLMPGVYTAPLLLAASAYLWWAINQIDQNKRI